MTWDLPVLGPSKVIPPTHNPFYLLRVTVIYHDFSCGTSRISHLRHNRAQATQEEAREVPALSTWTQGVAHHWKCIASPNIAVMDRVYRVGEDLQQ